MNNEDMIGHVFEICSKLIARLSDHPESLPFRYPVDRKTAYYYDVIDYPIDLATIEEQLTSYQTINDFFKDLLLLFDNCFVFNDSWFIVYERIRC